MLAVRASASAASTSFFQGIVIGTLLGKVGRVGLSIPSRAGAVRVQLAKGGLVPKCCELIPEAVVAPRKKPVHARLVQLAQGAWGVPEEGEDLGAWWAT